MPSTTPKGLPYPLPTEPLADGATAIKNLATAIDPLLASVVTALPASPRDGDEYVLVDSLSAPTYAWRMKYLQAAAKWLYLGGAPAMASVLTAEQATDGWKLLATDVTVTAPRAGLYEIAHGAQVHGNSTTQSTLYDCFAGIRINATDPPLAVDGTESVIPYFPKNPSSTDYSQLSGSLFYRKTLAAGDVLHQVYRSGHSGNVYVFFGRWLRLTPVTLT